MGITAGGEWQWPSRKLCNTVEGGGICPDGLINRDAIHLPPDYSTPHKIAYIELQAPLRTNVTELHGTYIPKFYVTVNMRQRVLTFMSSVAWWEA